MERSRRRPLLLSVVILLAIGFEKEMFGIPSQRVDSREALSRVRSSLLDPGGRDLSVRWKYVLGSDMWDGNGSLKIFGADYLKLTLEHQEILIQKSVVTSWFRETDQVIIDFFDRHDTSNIFSILLGDFSGFSSSMRSYSEDSLLVLTLKNETLVGFEELHMSIDEDSWLPTSISVRSGEDMELTIDILDARRLEDVNELTNATLTGREVIDLRE